MKQSVKVTSVGLFKALVTVLTMTCQLGYGQIQEMTHIKKTLPSISDSISYVNSLNRLAMLSHLRFRDSCLIYATRARDIAVRIDYKKGIADATNCQGIYYMSANNYLSAKFFNEALKIYQTIGDKSNEVQLLINISVLMFVSGSKTEALDYIYKANDKSKDLKNDSIRSIVLSDIITLDNRLSVWAKDSIYQKGLAIARKYRDTRMIISFENNEGTMLYNLGQKQKGLSILLASLKKADSIGCEYVKVSAYMTLGEMMLDLGKEKEGIAYYRKGLESSQKYGYPERYLMLAERLYNFYKERKLPEKAYEYAALLISKQNETSEDLKKSGYGYLSYVSKENELSQLKNDEEIRKNLILLMSCFSFLILVVLLLVYNSLRSKKKLILIERRLNNATEQRNLDLQAEASFKEKLISVIAHDIRQPFSSIVMLVSIFNASKGASEKEKAEIMEELKYISTKSFAFMDGILNWIKSKQNEREIIVKDLNVKSLIMEANSFFASDQERNNIKLIVDIADDLTILAHEQMMLFVFRNFLSNATKFSPCDSAIRVSSIMTNEHVIISVTDSGNGMTTDQLSELFKPNKKSDNGEGAGLALSISHDMVKNMRGQIWAESKPFKGSTFFVSMPIS